MAWFSDVVMAGLCLAVIIAQRHNFGSKQNGRTCSTWSLGPVGLALKGLAIHSRRAVFLGPSDSSPNFSDRAPSRLVALNKVVPLE